MPYKARGKLNRMASVVSGTQAGDHAGNMGPTPRVAAA